VALRVRQMAYVLVLLGAALGPLAPTLESSLTMQMMVHTFFLVAGALWLLSMALTGRPDFRRTSVGIWALLFAGAIAASMVNARYGYPAYITGYMWLTNMVVFFFIVNGLKLRQERLLLLAVICASTLVVSLHGIRQHEVDMPEWMQMVKGNRDKAAIEAGVSPQHAADLQGRIESGRVFSTYIIPNSFACALALALPAMAGLFADRLKRQKGREARFSWTLAAPFVLPLLIAFYFTKSKGGALGLGVAALVFVVWGFGGFLRRHLSETIIVATSIVIVFGMAQLSGLLPPLRDYGGSFDIRIGYSRVGMEVFEKNPGVGVGLDNFADAYAEVKQPGDGAVRRTHNDYVQIAAEMGIIGVILYLTLWFAFWRRMTIRASEPALPPEEKPWPKGLLVAGVLALALALFALESPGSGMMESRGAFFGGAWILLMAVAWISFIIVFMLNAEELGPLRNSFATIGMACGLIGFLVHSILDFNHYVPGLYQTVWIFMALVLSARMSEESPTATPPRQMHPATRLGLIGISTAIPMICLYLFVMPVLDASSLVERAKAPTGYSIRERMEFLQQAGERCPWQAESFATQSKFYLQKALAHDRIGAGGQTQLSQAIQLMRGAISVRPYHADYHHWLGRIYELRWISTQNHEDYQDTLNAYLISQRLSPTIPESALNLGRLYDLSGQYDLATGKYMRALHLSSKMEETSQFEKSAILEIEARIDMLTRATKDGAPPPRLKFRNPRLQTIPQSPRPKQP
jgi:O-Antigen ligase